MKHTERFAFGGQCYKKARFQSEAEAVAKNRRDHGVMADLYRAYRCSWCDYWHVGHIPGGRRKEKRRSEEMKSEKKQIAAFLERMKGSEF